MPGTDVTAAAANTLGSQALPGVRSNEEALAAYEQQFGALGDQVGAQDAYTQAMAGFQQQQLGISGQQLGLEQAGLGLTEQGQQLQKQLAGVQQGNEVAQYQNTQKQNLENYMYSLKNLQGQQAQSGALGAPGQWRDTKNLEQNFQTQAANAALAQASEVAGYQEQYGGGQFGAGQFGLTQQQNALAQQNLSLMAQANGLSEQELITQLNQSLAQNKQQGISSAGQLLAQMGNLATGDISQLGAAIAPIGYSQNINMLASPLGG